MALTWAAIVARALKKLDGVTAASHWDNVAGNPNLVALAKEGEREFCRLTSYFNQTSTSNIVATVATHTKPTGCLKIIGVCVNGIPIEEKNEAELADWYGDGWTAKTGTPAFYIPSGDSLLLVPIPDAAITNGLIIRNVYLPTQGATDASVAEEHLEVLSNYVTGIALDEDPANRVMSLFFYNEDYANPGKFQRGVAKTIKNMKGKNRQVIPRSTARSALNNYWTNS